jgi:hypothetical protein
LAAPLGIKSGAWKTAITDVLGVAEASVQNQQVDQPIAEAAVAVATAATTAGNGNLRRALLAAAANDVKVTYEVAVYGKAKLAAVQERAGDFNAGGEGSLTKLRASLEAIFTGAQAQLAGVTMAAAVDKVHCV